MSWINKVVQAHSESESPERFWYWSAVASMAAVMRKNVWMNRHYYKLYPNMYILLLAKSGMRKGAPISLAKTLVEKSEATKMIVGRNSVPKILYDLGRVKTTPTSVPYKEAQALIISGEFASLLVKDMDGLKILTDLYNTHEWEEKFTYSLKSGEDVLLKPCINIFGATNDDHFSEAIPKSDERGGFIGRTFIVHSTEKGIPNSLVDAPSNLVDTSSFVPFLKELAKLQGEFKWTKATGEYYKNWYNDFALNPPQTDVTGYYNRVGDSILKLAMILSLSKRLKLEMDLDSLQEAKAEAMNCGKAVHQISMGGSHSLSGQTAIIMKALLAHPDHKLTRKQILRRYWGDISQYDLDLVAETLLGAGAIKVENQGNERIYTMKDEIVKEYLDYERKVRGIV